MKRNLKKVIVIISLLFIIFTVALNLIIKNDVLSYLIPKENFWNQSDVGSDVQTNGQTNESNTTQIISHVAEVGETVTTNELSYTINSVKMSKNPEGLPVIDYMDEVKRDANGHITNNYSYIIMSLKIENLSNSEQEINFLNYKMQKEIGNHLSTSYETYAFDKNKERVNDKDYFFYSIKSHQSVDFTIGYIISDDKLSGNRYQIVINNSGLSSSNNEDVRYIHVI